MVSSFLTFASRLDTLPYRGSFPFILTALGLAADAPAADCVGTMVQIQNMIYVIAFIVIGLFILLLNNRLQKREGHLKHFVANDTFGSTMC